MDRKLIIFDLDGTVLPKVKLLDDRTVNAVRAATEAGHIAICSSARPFRMFRWVYDRMGLDTAISTLNGAHVYHPSADDFPVYECYIPAEYVHQILELCAECHCEPFYVERKDTLWYTDGRHNGYYKEHIATAEPLIKMDAASLPDTDASRIILTPPDREAADRISRLVSSFSNVAFTTWDFVPKNSESSVGIRMSISPASASKWHALQLIAGYYGIPNEDCYAFGDMWNDFEMIRNAGHGYAMKNSDAELNSGARNITRFDCAGCGVADVIEREILGLKGQ